MTLWTVIAGLAVAIVALTLQVARAATLAADSAWGVGSQGACQWRRRQLRLTAWFRPVDIVHLDIDQLKRLNAEHGEAGVNDRLRRALRHSDVYRLQHGDELVVFARGGDGHRVAVELVERLATVGVGATVVIAPRAWAVERAIAVAVERREAMKAAGQRGEIAIIEEALV